MKLNDIVSTKVEKEDIPVASVGAIIGTKDDEQGNIKKFLVEIFTVPSHPHAQLFYLPKELSKIQ